MLTKSTFCPHSVQYFVTDWLLLPSRIRSTALLCIVIGFCYITKHYVQDSTVCTQYGFCYCVAKFNYCTLLRLEWMSCCLKLDIVKIASYYYCVLLCIITEYFHLKCDILVFVIKGLLFGAPYVLSDVCNFVILLHWQNLVLLSRITGLCCTYILSVQSI